MKILMLASEFSPVTGGIATYARELAVAAVQLGADVTVVAPDYARVDMLIEDRSLPFSVRRFPGALHSMRDMPAKIRLARRAVGSDRHDIVHAVDWPFFIPTALARKKTQARLLMTVHGTEINEMQTVPKRIAVRAAGVFGARTEVTANSTFTRDLLLRNFAVAPERVRTVPLGVAEFWFGQRRHRLTVRRLLGIADDTVVMVTVARLTRRKGHLATLMALSSLPAHLRAHILWLVIGPDGERGHAEALRGAAARSGCNVRFLGMLPDETVRDIFGAADFFCMTGMPDPSGRVEGFGLVYLEAGASGLPSIATIVGGVGETVLAKKTGVLVEPTPATIAPAIALLSENAQARAMLGAAAREYARTLSWKRCAALTYGLQEHAQRLISLVPSPRASLPAASPQFLETRLGARPS
jgi:glycosyltransferase involved in cell wall biosynthesis